MTPDQPDLTTRLRALIQRGLFFARLALRMVHRAFAAAPPVKNAVAAPQSQTQIEDYEQLIEALQTGDIDTLDACAARDPGFARGKDGFIGQPWLFNAIDLGTLAALNWFLDHGASANAIDKDGRSALQAAVERCQTVDEFDDAPEDPLPLIETLVAHGGAVNAAARQGLTALHIAAATGATEAVALLLAHGADPSLRDEGFSGSTPLDYAVQARHEAVADLLRSHAANTPAK